MIFDFATDFGKLFLIIACGYVLLPTYALHMQPQWVASFTHRRFAVVAILTLAVVAIKIIEDVVAKESGPVDEAVLLFIRDHVPQAMNGFFSAITLTGSLKFLLPVAIASVAVLLVAKRRFEAILVGASVTMATALMWGINAIVGRARPALWEAQWYWGSSFPSGHTLNTAAFSIAAALAVARIWPRAGNAAMALALLWTSLVALSRLVLGVHWPSDVLAAICLGAFIPMLIGVAYDLRRAQGLPYFR